MHRLRPPIIFRNQLVHISAITGGTLFDNAVDNGVYGGSANFLPFTFAYAGSNYTSLRISSNGFVTLGGGTTPSTSVYFPVSDTGTAYNTSLLLLHKI